MQCGPWLRGRRDAILRARWHEGTQVQRSDHGLRNAPADALAIFDRAIAELRA